MSEMVKSSVKIDPITDEIITTNNDDDSKHTFQKHETMNFSDSDKIYLILKHFYRNCFRWF